MKKRRRNSGDEGRVGGYVTCMRNRYLEIKIALSSGHPQ